MRWGSDEFFSALFDARASVDGIRITKGVSGSGQAAGGVVVSSSACVAVADVERESSSEPLPRRNLPLENLLTHSLLETFISLMSGPACRATLLAMLLRDEAPDVMCDSGIEVLLCARS